MDPRIALCLEYLAPHIARDAVAITGSVAIANRTPHDLDLLIARRDAIAATVRESFLVSHYHTAMLQLVDPRAKIHIDLFLDTTGAIADAQPGPDGWLVLDDDDLLDHKLELLDRASAETPIDPKHADDARLLAKRLLRPPPVIDPVVLREDVYCTDVMLQCARCEIVDDFALAPKTAILAILGYV